MQLSRLSITGFKSFVEKTDMAFQPGITAIVGPNGCGKSNIADSIRWVLGEQSARLLRAERMEDLIFSGSKERKPMGMAEVSLTLTRINGRLSTEYEEINITRRLYRSGESEYFLNRVPCRLKDISELFMDTGLGTEPYAFIEQANIVAVVNGRPSERRRLLEEAAGVNKYKSRRKAALSKLESTDQNLLRVRDVITEVERSLHSLQRQARKAEKYRGYMERAKHLQLLLKHQEFLALKEGLEKEEKKLGNILMEREQLMSQIAQLEATLEAYRLDEIAKQKALSQAQRELFEFRQGIDKREAEAQRIRLGLQSLSEKAQQAEELQKHLFFKISQLREDLDQEKRRWEELKVALSFKEEAIKKSSSRLISITDGLKGLEKALEDQRKRNFILASSLTERRNKALNLKEQGWAQDRSLDKLKIRLEKAKTDRESLREALNQEASRLSQLEEEMVALLSEREKTYSLLLQEEGLKDGVLQKIETLRGELNLSRSRLESYQELWSKREGYNQGNSLLMGGDVSQVSSWPLLASLLEVEPKYERAIEALLSQDLQGIIVQDLASARVALTSLMDKKGHAILIPLEYPYGPILDPLPGDLPTGFSSRIEGRVPDLLFCPPNYKALLERLLGDSLIVRDMKTALELAEGGFWKGRIVTLNGEVIEPHGVIRTGPLDIPGFLAGQREMQRLREELTLEEIELVRWERELDERQIRFGELKEDLERLDGTLRKMGEEKVHQEKGLSRLEAEIRHLDGQIDIMSFELSELEKERAENSRALEIVEEEIPGLEKELRAEEEKGRSLQKEITVLSAERDKLTSAITELRLEKATIGERHQAVQVQIKRMESEIERLLSEEARQKEEVRLLLTRRCDEEKALTLLDAKLALLSQKEERSRNALASLEEEYGPIQERVRSLEAELHQRRRDLTELQERNSSFQVKIAEIKRSIRHLKEETWEDCQVDLEEFPHQEGIADPEAWKNELQEIKRRVHDLGPVNMAALEEYHSLEDRHTFLLNQASDLEESIRSLKETIAETNRMSQALFQETFEAVKGHFNRYFRHFFGGGRGELILQEGDEGEPGVEILVKPPGKKLGNLSLLSGGEKAMTGLAFFLALFTARPSPFCLLDEVDAPLDDSNIERFVSLLQELKALSQFVIITHNKRTMEAADLLYGITMEEPGISKLVSVRLAED